MALLAPDYLDAVVALGTESDGGVAWLGTGFFYGRLYERVDDTRSSFHVFLVTNKHVVAGQTEMLVRCNPLSNEPCRDFEIHVSGTSAQGAAWVGHPDADVDVAVIPINSSLLEEEGIRSFYFRDRFNISDIAELSAAAISEGAGVFVLGFPMGIVSPDRQYVICRSGCIARIRDCLDRKRKDFLIDALVFPGNSGGPVINIPELYGVGKTQPLTHSKLIGMVKSYIPYEDVAISVQTKRPKVVFEDNSGLTSVIPADFIRDTVEICFKQQYAAKSDQFRHPTEPASAPPTN